MKALSKRFVGALAVMAVLGSGIMPAHAAETNLVVSGRRTAYVDVTFDRPVTLRDLHAKITYRGSYAGWLIHKAGKPFSLGDNDVAGSFVMRNLAPPEFRGRREMINGLGDESNRTLEPGRYRLYLITDGVARVSVPAEGLSRTMVFEPKQRTRSFADAEKLPLQVDAAGAAGAGSVEDRIPVRSNRDTLSIVMTFLFARRGAMALNQDACFTTPGGDCGGRYGWQGAAFAVVPQQWGIGFMVLYEPGVLEPGKYDGVSSFDGGGTVYDARAAVFQVDLVL